MFFMWDLYLCAAKFLPGAGDDGSQFCLIPAGKLLDRFIPECKFNVITQFRIFSEVLIVERERIAQTLPDGRRERIGTAPRSQPRPDLHQTKRARHLQLFPQRGNAQTQLPTQIAQGGEFVFSLFMYGEVSKKLRYSRGNGFSKYHRD